MDEFAPETYGQSRSVFIDILGRYLTPQIIFGIRQIFDDTYEKCVALHEMANYISAFQAALREIPRWNTNIIEAECVRIKTQSQCSYMEDILSCVHILHIKLLTCIRVGNHQKKIDVSCPKLANFIHKVYISVARKIYVNAYLFQKVTGMELQKNNRELEVIVQECITGVMLDSLPTETIIRAYLDEVVEEEEEVFIEPIPIDASSNANVDTDTSNKNTTDNEKDNQNNTNNNPPELVPIQPSFVNVSDEPVVTRLTFNDFDQANDGQSIHAPKTIDRLEALSDERYAQRRSETEDDNDDGATFTVNDKVDLDDIFDMSVADTQPGLRQKDTSTASLLDIIEL
jgi:hypothetical protein